MDFVLKSNFLLKLLLHQKIRIHLVDHMQIQAFYIKKKEENYSILIRKCTRHTIINIEQNVILIEAIREIEKKKTKHESNIFI